jgi:hypothetical protein
LNEFKIFRIIDRIDWQPEIGDPTFMGWLIVFAYAVCFIACCYCMGRAVLVGRPKPKTALFWFCAAALMLVLGINKQLDLQTLLTQIGRAIAKEQGWYETRRNFQAWFITGIAICGGATIATLGFLLRTLLKENLIGFLGMGLLCLFIVIRAASFHKVDRMLGMELLGLRINPLIELSGIMLVLANFVKSCRRSQGQKHITGQ